MKKETCIKIMQRYIKGLETMEIEARTNGDIADAEHYQMDKSAFTQAVKTMERSNT